MTNKEREQRIDKLSDLFGFELPIDKWISSFLNRPSINVPATARFFGQKDPEYNDRSYVSEVSQTYRSVITLRKSMAKMLQMNLI
jgi:hypothetical protein